MNKFDRPCSHFAVALASPLSMAVTSIPALLNSSQQHQPRTKGSSYAPLEPGLWKTACASASHHQKNRAPGTSHQVALALSPPPQLLSYFSCLHLRLSPNHVHTLTVNPMIALNCRRLLESCALRTLRPIGSCRCRSSAIVAFRDTDLFLFNKKGASISDSNLFIFVLNRAKNALSLGTRSKLPKTPAGWE